MVGCPLLVTLTWSVLSCLVLLSIFVSLSVKSLALVSFTILFSFFIFIIFWQKMCLHNPESSQLQLPPSYLHNVYAALAEVAI